MVVNDRMQRNYVYYRSEPVGKHFDDGFDPDLTPQQMLELGVFGGKYMTGAIRRHIAQIKKNCRRGDLNCHRRQRQAVLHWAYDSRKI